MNGQFDARALFAAAREDGPSSEARGTMYERVALVTGAAAATVAVASTAPASAVPSAAGIKLLVGGIVGAVAAVGVAVTLGVSGTAPGSESQPVEVREPPRDRRVVLLHSPAAGAKLDEPLPRGRAPVATDPSPPLPVQALRQPAASGFSSDASSSLATEARLVTEARHALMSGAPERALALVRATKSLHGKSMEPEELGLEARALRALGRVDEAAATEFDLRRRFPDHALAR